MKKYLIVVSAVDWKHGYFLIISNTIGLLDSVIDWSLDLDEADKVLHIIATKDIRTELKEYLSLFDAEFTVSEVFDD